MLNQTLWKDDRAKNVTRTKHGDDNDDDYVKIDDDDDDDGGDNDEDVKIAKLVLWRRQRASYEEELFFQSHRGYWSLLESWSSLGHHFFVVLVILVIENSSKSRGRKKLETLELDSNLKTICHLLDNYPFPPSHQSFRWKSGKVKKENKIKEIQA